MITATPDEPATMCCVYQTYLRQRTMYSYSTLHRQNFHHTLTVVRYNKTNRKLFKTQELQMKGIYNTKNLYYIKHTSMLSYADLEEHVQIM